MNNRELQIMTMAEAALTLLIAVGAFFFADTGTSIFEARLAVCPTVGF